MTKTKDLSAPGPHIVWKAVEPRHYTRAQERKKESKAAYIVYVLSLVERFYDRLVAAPGQSPGVGAVQLEKDQIEQVLKAFEEKFGAVE